MTSSANTLAFFTRSPAHTLRTTCIFTFIPGFVTLLVHAIISESVLPGIGLLPLFFSTIFSALAVFHNKESPHMRSTLLEAVYESIIAAGLFVVLVLCWVYDMGDHGWRANPGFIMLGTYGTAFMLLNLVIHVLFLGNYLRNVLRTPSSCPHCQHCQHTTMLNETATSDEECARLVDEEELSRPSVDETVVGSLKDVV